MLRLCVCVCVNVEKLTACVCDLSQVEARQGHRGQESVCAVLREAERCVTHAPLCQDQGIGEQEQTQVSHLLICPTHTHTHTQSDKMCF